MMKRITSGLAVAAMALAFVAISSARADAAFIAYICDDLNCSGGNDIIVADGAAGDGAATTGAISINGSVGGLTFVSNVSQGSPLIGSANEPQLDITFSASGTGAAYLFASETDFTLAGPATGVLAIGGTGTGVVQAGGFGGTSNDTLDLSNLFVLFNGLNGSTSGAFDPTTNPYSLTLGVYVDRSGRGTTTGDANLTVVPEPASMALFGLGLLGAGLARRRQRT